MKFPPIKGSITTLLAENMTEDYNKAQLIDKKVGELWKNIKEKQGIMDLEIHKLQVDIEFLVEGLMNSVTAYASLIGHCEAYLERNEE